MYKCHNILLFPILLAKKKIDLASEEIGHPFCVCFAIFQAFLHLQIYVVVKNWDRGNVKLTRSVQLKPAHWRQIDSPNAFKNVI